MQPDNYLIKQEETKKIERISWKKIGQDTLDAVDLDTGIMHSIISIFRNPGKMIRGYFNEKRYQYVNPFRFLLVSTSLVVFAFIQLIDFNELYEGLNTTVANTKEEETFEIIQDYFNSYFNLILLSMLPFFTLASFWIFKNPRYNFPEHLYLNAYLLSATNILGLLLIPISFIPSLPNYVYTIYVIICTVYLFYFYVSVFNGKVITLLFKSLLSFILSYLLYTIVIVLIIVIYSLVMNN